MLVLGAGTAAAPGLDEGGRVLDILLESLPASEAAKLAARITDAPRTKTRPRRRSGRTSPDAPRTSTSTPGIGVIGGALTSLNAPSVR